VIAFVRISGNYAAIAAKPAFAQVLQWAMLTMNQAHGSMSVEHKYAW
jgi:hypothetical protein